MDNKERIVRVLYKKRLRNIKPIEVYWGTSQWHPGYQWLLRAKDMEDGTVKEFAMTGFEAWQPAFDKGRTW